jgi:DnaJ-class molecular chaperone
MKHNFTVLNLEPDAPLSEVKKAFRALAKYYHPDSARADSGDPEKFQEVHSAYQTLLRGFPAGSQPGAGTMANDAYRFEGVYDRGLNIYYALKLSPAASLEGVTLTLPLKHEEACPRCLGSGYTFRPNRNSGSLKRSLCPRCRATGVISHNEVLNMDLEPGGLESREIRLPGKGHYNPATSGRGDLIIKTEIDETF